jgi:hypothetical protein
MSQKKNKKRLKINQQGSPGGIGFTESKIEQGQLYSKKQRDNQQLMCLSFLNVKRAAGDFGPKKNNECGHAETESRCCECPQPGEADFNSYSICPKNYA